METSTILSKEQLKRTLSECINLLEEPGKAQDAIMKRLADCQPVIELHSAIVFSMGSR